MKKNSRFAFVANTFSRVLSSRSERDKAPRSARLGLESLESRELLSASSWEVLPTCDELDLNPVESAAPLDASTPSCEALLAAIDETSDASPQDVFYDVAPTDSPEAADGEYELVEVVPNATTRVVTSLGDSINDTGSLRYLISIAQDGDTIKFDSSLNGKTITLGGSELLIQKSISIIAESPSGEKLAIGINGNNSSTIINIKGSSNSARLNVTLKGITLINGYSEYAAGVRVTYSNLTIRDSLITGCNATVKGGGINIYDSTITIEDTTISGCSAGYSGGGISLNSGQATLVNSVVTGCHTTKVDGPLLAVGEGGGGIFLNDGNTLFTAYNCLIANNHATACGGGILTAGVVDLYNCTVANNTSSLNGGGIYIYEDGQDIYVHNSIILKNQSANGGADVHFYSSHDYPVINTYSWNTLTSFTGWNLKSSNYTYNSSQPLFTNEGNGDYTLAPNSQAINKGRNDLYELSSNVDLAGKTRISGGTIDLGAYEYQTKQLATPTPSGTSTGSTIKVSWNVIANASGYEVVFNGTTYTFDASTRSHTFTGLKESTSYKFVVRAVGDGLNFSTSPNANLTVATKALTQLDRPTLTVSGRTSKSLTVKWNAISNAKSYVVSYAVKSSNPEYQTKTVSSSSTSTTITGLQPNTSYYVKVQAKGDGVTYKDSSQSPTVTTKTALAVPSIKSKSSTAKTITVTWNAVSGASGYTIVCGDKTANVAASETSKTFTGLTSNKSYSIKIKAKGNGTSTYDSDYSTAISYATKAPEQLARPTLTASGQTSNSLTVKWDAIPNAKSYLISYAVKATSPQYQTTTAAASKTSATISGLKANTSYYVKIQAIGDGAEYTNSQNSPTLTAKTALAVPTITGKSAKAKSITVKWGAVEGATGYTVVCGSKTANVAASETTTTFTGLTPNTSYSIKIKAKGNGTSTFDSAYSAAVTQATSAQTQLARPALTATGQTSTTLTVKWGAIANASSYVISYAVKSSTPEYQTKTIAASKTSATITGLQANTNYYVKIQAKGDGDAYADSSQSPTVTAKTALAAPTFTSKSATAKTITLKWGAVSGATGYTVVCGSKTANVDSSTTTTTFTGLTAQTAYSIKIMAKGNGTTTFDSDYSAAVSYSTTAPAQLDRPALTATGQTSTTLTVQWGAIANAKSYELSYAVKASTPEYQTKTIAASKTSATIAGLQANTNYYVKIRAIGDGVEYTNSSQSPTVTAKTALAVPAISSKSATANSITVKWNAVSGAAGYTVVCGSKTKTVEASATTATITGLTANTSYSVKIRANGNGTTTFNSDYSAAVTQETSGATQLARPVLTVTGTTANSIAVAWDAVPNASSYTISYAVKSATPEYQTLTIAASKTNHTITGLAANTNYYVKIRANGDGDSYLNSAQSATQTARTAAANSNAILDAEFDEEFFEEDLDELLAVNWLNN